MATLPKNVSESVKRLNPHLFALGGLATRAAERAVTQALDRDKPQRKQSKGRVAIVVTIIACRRRLSDDDAIAASIKPLRDGIAASLGIDDGDARIKFQYAQCQTIGQTGVIVKIEALAILEQAKGK